MKHLIRVSCMMILCLAGMALCHAQSKKGFVIHGKLTGLKDGTRLFLVTNNSGIMKDTVGRAKANNEQFTFKGVLPQEGVSHFVLIENIDSLRNAPEKPDRYIALFMENRPVTVRGNLKDLSLTGISVSGLPAHADKIEYTQLRNKLYDDRLRVPIEKLYKALTSNETSVVLNLRDYDQKVAIAKKPLDSLLEQWVAHHPHSLYTPYLIRIADAALPWKEDACKKLSPPVLAGKQGTDLQEYLTMEQATMTGAIAPAFSYAAADGTNISLQEVVAKGKVTLVDFWASWCKPCRAAFPKMKKLYATYHSQGLNILGYSIDKQEDAWKNALKAENLPWDNIRETTPVADKKYGITAIPAVWILDSTGRIIAKNLRGKELEEKIAAIMQPVPSQTYTITGKLDDVKNALAMLQYRVDKGYELDSVAIKNGKFTFTGTIAEPAAASIYIKPLDRAWGQQAFIERDHCDFYLDPGITTINGANAKTASIAGGPSQKEFVLLEAQRAPLTKQQHSLQLEWSKARALKEQQRSDSLLDEIKGVRELIQNKEADFIKAHPASYVSWDLFKLHSFVSNLPALGPLLLALDKKFRDSEFGKKMQDMIDVYKKTDIGMPAIDFTLNDVDEKPVSLHSIKGKYVLLDFWSSWCKPCRAENPYLVKAYNRFKEKQFEIMAVSLDDKKEKWVEAIKKDNLPWIHVSELKGWASLVPKQYGIHGIPANFLIAPNGNIIARNLRGDTLEKELEKLLTK